MSPHLGWIMRSAESTKKNATSTLLANCLFRARQSAQSVNNNQSTIVLEICRINSQLKIFGSAWIAVVPSFPQRSASQKAQKPCTKKTQRAPRRAFLLCLCDSLLFRVFCDTLKGGKLFQTVDPRLHDEAGNVDLTNAFEASPNLPIINTVGFTNPPWSSNSSSLCSAACFRSSGCIDFPIGKSGIRHFPHLL